MTGKTEPIPIISADSHTLEPGDLWANHMSSKYKNRVELLHEFEGKKGDFISVAPLRPFDVTSLGTAGIDGDSVATMAFGFRYRIFDSLDFGAVAEYPVTANEDVIDWRFTTDLIWRPFGWRSVAELLGLG